MDKCLNKLKNFNMLQFCLLTLLLTLPPLSQFPMLKHFVSSASISYIYIIGQQILKELGMQHFTNLVSFLLHCHYPHLESCFSCGLLKASLRYPYSNLCHIISWSKHLIQFLIFSKTCDLFFLAKVALLCDTCYILFV